MSTLTLKNPPTITYKKRKHPRAFKVWDSEVLTHIMQECMQIKYNIMQESVSSNRTLPEMGHVAIRALDMYSISDTYLRMYNLLLKEGLIQTGNLINSKTLH